MSLSSHHSGDRFLTLGKKSVYLLARAHVPKSRFCAGPFGRISKSNICAGTDKVMQAFGIYESC